MQWDKISGHYDNVKMLKTMLATGRMPHALLFTGPEGIGKMTVAHVLAASLLCVAAGERPCGSCMSCQLAARVNHPDLIIVRAEGASIKIDQIRALKHEAGLVSKMGKYRVCLIEDAERMTAHAANSLLKLLEEPPEYFIFILVSSAPHLLLSTIISRAVTVRFQSLSYDLLAAALVDRGVFTEQATVAARLSGGRMGVALALLEPGGFAIRDQAAEVILSLPGGGIRLAWDTAQALDKTESKEVVALLQYLMAILRDMLVIRIGQGARLLFNVDIFDKLAGAARLWDERTITIALKETEGAIRALNANANVRLTMEALMIKLTDLATKAD